MGSAEHESALLEELRPTAFAIAYRMLGSVSDAEDVVQEALLRLHAALEEDREISSPRAYLTTVVTRLCIDVLRSARHRREHYVGEWLPEPLVGAEEPRGTERVELAESVSMAFLVLLESLSPSERAVLLLRDVFDYDYGQIAEIVGKSEAACRQLVVRARAHVLERRPRFPADRGEADALAERFFRAIEAGDLAELEAILSSDVALHGDGGGKVPALARAVRGRREVARTLLAWARAGARAGGYEVQRTVVNGQAGALIRSATGAVVGVWALDVRDGRITAIRSVVNPDKLRHIPGRGHFGAWLKGEQ